MKKTALLIIALILCLATLASCGLIQINPGDIESEGWIEVTADTKDDCFKLVDEFLEETLKDANVVVTVEEGGEVQFIESILGDKSCVEKNSDESKMYAFKRGDEYIAAVDGAAQYYLSGKDYYDQYYYYFLTQINMLRKTMPNDQATFAAKMRTEEKNGESTATLTFDVTADLIF